MRKQILIVLFSMFSLLIGAGANALTTMTYNGSTYFQTSRYCSTGLSTFYYQGKWWCPYKSTATAPKPTPTPTPAPAPTPTTYTAQISWSIPSMRTNGTALPLSELAGYEIYYTTDNAAVSGVYKVSGGSISTYKATNLAKGNYYFTISAIDSKGLKSPMSTMVPVKFGL